MTHVSQSAFVADDERESRLRILYYTVLLQYFRLCRCSARRRCSASAPWYKASTQVQALWGRHTDVGQCAISLVRSHRAGGTSATPPNSEHRLQQQKIDKAFEVPGPRTNTATPARPPYSTHRARLPCAAVRRLLCGWVYGRRRCVWRVGAPSAHETPAALQQFLRRIPPFSASTARTRTRLGGIRTSVVTRSRRRGRARVLPAATRAIAARS